MQTLVNVTLPEMGESVTEGSIVEWRVKPGTWVDEGQTLVDVTTDKVDVEVPAPAAGIVTAVHGGEGDTISVGTVIAEIDTTATKPEGAAAAPAATAVAAPAPAASTPAVATAPTAANGGAKGTASHRAQRMLERLHLSAAGITGSGPDGMILHHDVERAIAAGTAGSTLGGNGAAASPAATVTYPAVPATANVVDIKGAAATLATYMDQSLSLPVATSFRTLGVGTLEAKRAALNAAVKNAGRSEKISFTHLIAFALARAARELPFLTASFRRDDGKPKRVEGAVNLGLAVDVERKDGSRFLVVPVLKGADVLDFVRFRAAYEELVAKARDGKLTVEEQSGASFTLTNPGGIGTVASIPRLMVGQGAIIAVGAIQWPPGFGNVAPDTLKSLGVEKIMQMTSTYDHRVIQGAQSGEFLARVDALLGGADGFFDEVQRAFNLGAISAPQNAPATGANASARAVEAAPATFVASGAPSEEMLRAIAAGMGIVSAYRRHGHLAATVDPLGAMPVGDPSLDPANWNLTPALMNAIPASVLRVKVPGTTLADVYPKLRETYSSTIAYEIEHISNTQQREWLRDYIEGGRNRVTLPIDRKVQLLERLTKVETMERYFRKQFMSQKTFSIEGLDVMVPMLEELVTLLAEEGTTTAVIGMAHRGRLATIAHVVNRPYEELLSEFESAALRETLPDAEDSDATGDVKYHHGAVGEYVTPAGTPVTVRLANNPSHLEAVDGVVEGMTRSLQTDHASNPARVDHRAAAPVLIHGDAAFMGQGIVAEVFNLQSLAGYSTGGTIHIIADNQVGFTTDPSEDRSTRYASDLAKGFDVPIVHVNADDVESCIAAIRLAVDYRRAFHRDVVIDLIGYRRFGHNEQDEPAYTQPIQTEAIKSHPTVRELFAQKLVAEGAISTEDVAALQARATARITDAHKAVKSGTAGKLIGQAGKSGSEEAVGVTAVKREKLLEFARALTAIPSGFNLNKKLQGQFQKRAQALEESGEVDWGMAEGLAFASLISEGVPVRLTGQDTERGTFSHRHAVFHDTKRNYKHVPLQNLSSAKASFEIHNSPLSEYACLGFEYGYSTVTSDALVLWEAQFGDFNNGAQIIIDQFIAAGAAKWGQSTRLTLLLPHGYEGAGPEHSSARIERFLQLSAEGNIRVANCSTAAQYFHLLRVQATAANAYPLVVMTPKSLLRARAAYGKLDELASGGFREVIDDPRYEGDGARPKAGVTRLLLCSGKVYYDFVGDERYGSLQRTAIARLELLSPLPRQAILDLIATYPDLEEVTWVQEEPKNMGARAHVRRRIVADLPSRIRDMGYIGRPYRASPSEGYPGAHIVEQERIVGEALTE